ncbi:hypothetical protein J6590_068068 [Homalodisca vitripennis]|nr:hypothetical protein J6590_068068 [Homalodisca vitripennis]
MLQVRYAGLLKEALGDHKVAVLGKQDINKDILQNEEMSTVIIPNLRKQSYLHSSGSLLTSVRGMQPHSAPIRPQFAWTEPVQLRCANDIGINV